MKIHIMRHGESEANVNHILAGQLDYPLSEKGKQDAHQIASWYTSHYNPKIIYCAPLLRAKQTAEPFVVATPIPLTIDARLMEQNLGVLSGKTYEEAESDPRYETNKSARWDWNIKGGESYKDIATRIHSFFIGLDPDGPDTLIVTHAVAMRLIRGLLENTLPLYPEHIARNGEIWEVNFEKVGVSHEITSLFADSVAYEEHRS